MKVDYVSDLHINHYVPFRQNQAKWEIETKKWIHSLLIEETGNVLIVAGDFSEWNVQTIWALEVFSQRYEKVFFCFGNHDYYLISNNQKKKYGDSQGRIDEILERTTKLENVLPLHGNLQTYKGFTFGGHALWYDLKTIKDKVWFKTQSADSEYIFTSNFEIEHYKALYITALEWYMSIENKEIDIFVSHFPPLHPPISPHDYNACYVAPVPFLTANHWVFGHQHIQGVFEKADVQFHANALGYPHEKLEKIIKSFNI